MAGTYIEFDPVPIYDPDVGADTVSALLFHALPAMTTGWYFYFEIYIPQLSMDIYMEHVTGNYIFSHRAASVDQIQFNWTAISGVPTFEVRYLNATFPNNLFYTPIITDTWLPIELAHGHQPKIGDVTAPYFYTTASAAGTMKIGHSSTSNDYHQIVLIRNIKVGTSYGASDLLKFDDTSTDLSMFDGGIFPMPPTYADVLVTSVGDVTFHSIPDIPDIPKNVWAFTGGNWTEFSRFGTGALALWGFVNAEWQQLMRSVGTALSNNLIFHGYRNSSADWQSIYCINADGTALTEIFPGSINGAADPVDDWFTAHWSRDKTLIYGLKWWENFIDPTAYQVWSVNADGTNLQLVYEINEGWSSRNGTHMFMDTPNGLKIVQTVTVGINWTEIRMHDVSSSSYDVILVESDLPPAYQVFPSLYPGGFQFSTDGEKICFWKAGPLYSGLFTMNIDGSNLQGPILTSANLFSIGAFWGNGTTSRKLLFTRDASDYGLSVINDDGTDETILNHTSPAVLGMAWSPDGTQILYSTGSSGDPHVMNADGTGDITFSSYPSSYGGGFGNLTFSNDGTQFAIIGGNPVNIGVIDIPSDTFTEILDSPTISYAEVLSWSNTSAHSE